MVLGRGASAATQACESAACGDAAQQQHSGNVAYASCQPWLALQDLVAFARSLCLGYAHQVYACTELGCYSPCSAAVHLLPKVVVDGQVATKALAVGPASVVVKATSEDVAGGGVAIAEEGVVAYWQACKYMLESVSRLMESTVALAWVTVTYDVISGGTQAGLTFALNRMVIHQVVSQFWLVLGACSILCY